MTKTVKTYRMKMRVRRPDVEDVHVMQDVAATNAWDAEARATAVVKRQFPDAYAVYAVTKKRVTA